MKANRRLIATERILKRGIVNFTRNLWLAIAAISVITITLSILLFSVVANVTFSNTISQITSKINVSVYLKDSVTKTQTDDLISHLQALPNVQSVTYQNKDQVLAAYREQNKTNADLLAAISQTDNPLPPTIHIKPRDPNKLQDIKNYLDKKEIANLQAAPTDYSGDRKEAIDKITKATKFMREIGIAGIIIFMIISMLIIFNTIRMAIFNRRDELSIMRLLGASTWFIRGPFVVETVIYGIVASLISLVICYSIFVVSSTAFEASSLGLLDISYAGSYFKAHLVWILLIQLMLGIMIGAVSSVVATQRYLRFKTSK